jgi:translin
MEHCESVLAVMDEIYGDLVTMDYPDAMTGGLRRTTDAVRGILERTRGDFTVSRRQSELERKLDEFRRKLD